MKSPFGVSGGVLDKSKPEEHWREELPGNAVPGASDSPVRGPEREQKGFNSHGIRFGQTQEAVDALSPQAGATLARAPAGGGSSDQAVCHPFARPTHPGQRATRERAQN